MIKKIALLLALLSIAAILLAFSFFKVQERSVGQIDEFEFAQTSLENYVNYALTEENVKNFGFRDLKEAQSAVVGKPIKVYSIPLDALKKYESGSTASRLLSENVKLYFPVLVGEEVRTKIEIIQIDKEWVAGEFGGIEPAQLVDKTYQRLPRLLRELSATKVSDPVLVQIPALHATLFLIQADEREYFVSATMQPERFKLEDGQLYPADKLLSILSEYAQIIKEDVID